jgi:tetratricopeptide (TPR) repeat protein
MRILLLVLAWLIFFAQSVRANDPAELFRQANVTYEQKDFPGAAAKYRQIVAQGKENGAVYYNMGNAFFKAGKLGEAILAYEKALKYLPRDEDIRTNLEFARLLTVNKEHKEERLNFSILFERFLKNFTVNEWTYSFEIAYAILFFSAIITIFSRQDRIKRTAVRSLITVLPILFILGTFTGIRIYRAKFRKEAVVIEKNIKVHSGPAKNYTLLFSVPEGTRLLIHQQREEWLQVTLPNGYNGWVSRRSVGII